LLSSPSPAFGPGMALWSVHLGSRSRSRTFSVHAIAPNSRWPPVTNGSIGLSRGDPSSRNVASRATRASSRRVLPGSAISGAASSRSRQFLGQQFVHAAEDLTAIDGLDESETLRDVMFQLSEDLPFGPETAADVGRVVLSECGSEGIECLLAGPALEESVAVPPGLVPGGPPPGGD